MRTNVGMCLVARSGIPLLVALLLLCLSPAAASAATFSVSDNGDTDHGYAAGTCPNPCTLRDAIDAVNSGAGTGDDINFLGVAPPAVIQLAAGLPTVTKSVTIDGGTLGDIELRGVAFAFGLDLNGGTHTVRDLVINRFPNGPGFNVWNTATASIVNNIIGTDTAGTPAIGNAAGIRLATANNVVRDNTISGNTAEGIQLNAAPNAVIAGNRIGVTPSGTAALGNGTGIVTTDIGATNVTVGGPLTPDRNVISGNGSYGVLINVGATTGWTIRNNAIGTNAADSGDRQRQRRHPHPRREQQQRHVECHRRQRGRGHRPSRTATRPTTTRSRATRSAPTPAAPSTWATPSTQSGSAPRSTTPCWATPSPSTVNRV